MNQLDLSPLTSWMLSHETRFRLKSERLFDMGHDLTEGLLYVPDFLGIEEERELIEAIAQLEFKEFRMHGVVAKRRVAHFGWGYSFDSRQLTEAPEIPQTFEPVRNRAADIAGVQPFELAELLVTEYQPGAGIGWHRDAPPFGIVVGISLAGRCRMRFQKGTGAQRQTAAIDLEARSLYLLTGSARREWQHTIPPAKELRYSMTFRTLRTRGKSRQAG